MRKPLPRLGAPVALVIRASFVIWISSFVILPTAVFGRVSLFTWLAKFCLWIRLAQVFTCSVTLRPGGRGSTCSFRSSHPERSVVVFAVVGGGKISRAGLTDV